MMTIYNLFIVKIVIADMEIINIAKNATNDVQSSRQMSRRETEIICWEAKLYQVMNQYLNAPDTYNETSAAASSIRSNILDKNRWKFARSYGGAEILTSFRQHLKWIITGAKDTLDLNAKKKKNMDETNTNIREIIITSTK